jgi:hypothetical protein
VWLLFVALLRFWLLASCFLLRLRRGDKSRDDDTLMRDAATQSICDAEYLSRGARKSQFGELWRSGALVPD